MEKNDLRNKSGGDRSDGDNGTSSKFQRGNTYFDGGMLAHLGISVITFLGAICTLFIALPWMVCLKERWVCRHTVIDGRRLRFTGSGGSLFGNYIKWFLLCIITLLIYTIWVDVRMKQWTQEHTFFADSNRSTGSHFTGSVLGNLGRELLVALVTFLTFGIGTSWMYCYKMQWICAHSTIENNKLCFFGKGGSLLGHTLLWMLLSIVTLGIFALWLPIKRTNWDVKHLKFIN